MAKKLSAIESQLMSFRQCMAVCAIDMTTEIYKKGRWLALILAAILAVGYFWEDITWAGGAILSGIWHFLQWINLEGFFHFLGKCLIWSCKSFYNIFIHPIGVAYDVVNENTQWAKLFLYDSRICETISEGEAKKIVCHTSDSPLNFIALAISGVVAIVLTSLWLLPTTVLLSVSFSGKYSFFNKNSWMCSLLNQIEIYKEISVSLLIFWPITAILAALFGYFSMPMLMSAASETISIYSWILIFLPIFLVVIPFVLLMHRLYHSEESIKRSLKTEAYETNLAHTDINIMYSKIDDISEGNKPTIVRFIILSCAGGIFITSCYYGAQLPSYYGLDIHAFWGFLAGAILSCIALAITLSGLITCYVDVRDQVDSIREEMHNYEKLSAPEENTEPKA